MRDVLSGRGLDVRPFPAARKRYGWRASTLYLLRAWPLLRGLISQRTVACVGQTHRSSVNRVRAELDSATAGMGSQASQAFLRTASTIPSPTP